MLIRVNKANARKTSGMPRANVNVSAGMNAMGAEQITLAIQAFDTYDVVLPVANLYLSPGEARALADCLIAAAGK